MNIALDPKKFQELEAKYGEAFKNTKAEEHLNRYYVNYSAYEALERDPQSFLGRYTDAAKIQQVTQETRDLATYHIMRYQQIWAEFILANGQQGIDQVIGG